MGHRQNFKDTPISQFYLSKKCLSIRKIIPSTKAIISEIHYNFKPITEEEILNLRTKLISAVIFKVDNEYFYSRVPKSFKLYTASIFLEGFKEKIGTHICGKNCNRLSAAEDEFGGCAKVRDISTSALSYEDGISFKKALINSERIEKYSFIKMAV